MSPRTSRRTAYAGAFTDLRARGVVRAPAVRATVAHRFTPGFVETRWSLRRRRGRMPLTVDVLFPSRGVRATLRAVGGDGELRPVGRRRRPLPPGGFLHVRSRTSGYVVVPQAKAPLTVRALGTERGRFEPDPGPTLAVGLARRDRLARASLVARLAPVPRGADPLATARRIAGGAPGAV